MPVPNLCVVFHLNFFLFRRGYGNGVPLLQYSAPVVKTALDDVKVRTPLQRYRLNPLFLTCDADLG